MLKTIPESFLMLTHEGLMRVNLTIESIQSMDQVLARFSGDKQAFIPHVGETPYGPVHVSAWTGASPRTWAIQELTQGQMMLSTQYADGAKGEVTDVWVSPTFLKAGENGFPLRCLFDFGIWAKAGLRMFMGLNIAGHGVYLWVLYDQGTPQIYRPPFGNIFEASCQVCLGHNEAQLRDAFFPGPMTGMTVKMIELLASSNWNHDTFRSSDIAVLKELVRFDATKPDLPMLPPTDPSLITKCSIASNKELADMTLALLRTKS